MVFKAIICGEGPNDVGRLEYSTNNWKEGPIFSYIKNTSTVDLELYGITYKDLKSYEKKTRFQKRSDRDIKNRHRLKSLRLALYAEGKFNVAFCYVDCDSNNFEDLYNAINQGFLESKTDIIGLAIIPKLKIESWLLADENAYLQCYGKIPTQPPLPRKPEEMSQDHNDDNYPKKYIRRVFDQYHKQAISEEYVEIANRSRVETLKTRCPLSFGQFYDDIQSKLRPL